MEAQREEECPTGHEPGGHIICQGWGMMVRGRHILQHNQGRGAVKGRRQPGAAHHTRRWMTMGRSSIARFPVTHACEAHADQDCRSSGTMSSRWGASFLRRIAQPYNFMYIPDFT